MNLTGVFALKTLLAFDENTGEVTITFKDPAETTTYGTIVMEITKNRPFFEAMAEIAEAYSTDYEYRMKRRTVLNANENTATTDFSA